MTPTVNPVVIVLAQQHDMIIITESSRSSFTTLQLSFVFFFERYTELKYRCSPSYLNLGCWIIVIGFLIPRSADHFRNNFAGKS